MGFPGYFPIPSTHLIRCLAYHLHGRQPVSFVDGSVAVLCYRQSSGPGSCAPGYCTMWLDDRSVRSVSSQSGALVAVLPPSYFYLIASGKCRRVVQGHPECSWSTRGGCGPRGPPDPLRSILIHTFSKFYQKCGLGWIRLDQEDQGYHNPPSWTRTDFCILLMWAHPSLP